MAQMVKNLPAMRETWVQSLGWEDPLEKGMATYNSILAWRISWTVLYGLSHKDSDMTERLTPRAQRAVRSPLGSCTASSSCETFEKDVLWAIQSFSNKLKCFLTAFALL